MFPRPCKDLLGSVKFDGRELLSLPDDELNAIRGADIAMVVVTVATAIATVATGPPTVTTVVATYDHSNVVATVIT